MIVARIKAGEEPVPEPMAVTLANGPTVADLAAVYLDQVVAVRLKPASAKAYRGVIEKHILPALGRKAALSLDHAAVTALHHGLAETPAMANRAVEMLFRIYRAAEERELIPEGSNPCRQIAMNRQRRHERFLTDEEFRRLGRVLDEAERSEGGMARAAMAIRLLLLTGCRKNEILSLRWDHVDLEAREMRLGDSKTGPPDGAAVAGRHGRAGAEPADRRQPPRRPGHAEGKPHERSAAALGQDPQERRAGGHAPSRLPAFVRVAGAGARGKPADDRPPARP